MVISIEVSWNQLLCHLKVFALSSNSIITDTQLHPCVCDCLALLMIVTADQIRNGSLATFWFSQSIQLRLTFWGKSDKSVVSFFLSFTFLLLLIYPWNAGHPVIFGRIFLKWSKIQSFLFPGIYIYKRLEKISHSCIENPLDELN